MDRGTDGGDHNAPIAFLKKHGDNNQNEIKLSRHVLERKLSQQTALHHIKYKRVICTIFNK